MDIVSFNHASQAHNKIDDINGVITTLLNTIGTMQNQIDTLNTAIANINTGGTGTVGEYATLVQDINTRTVYKDQFNGKSYKIYISNNNVALEVIDEQV